MTHLPRKLRLYQKNVFYNTLKNKHNALFLQMRLGKTLVSIRSIVSKHETETRTNEHSIYKSLKVLIIAPYSAFSAWYEELQREGFKPCEIITLSGESKERRKDFYAAVRNNQVKWFILNTEGWRAIPEIANTSFVKWFSMVFDESYSLQSPPHISKKTKKDCGSKFYTKNFRDIPHKYILTGTPAPESPLNYFMQLLFLDRSILGIDNYWQFRTKYFIQYGRNEYAISEKGKKFLTERLATCAQFLSRKDVNLGGEKIYEKRLIQVDKATRKIYDNMLKNFVIERSDKILDTTDVAGVRFMWARRLLGGFCLPYEVDETASKLKVWEHIFPGKLIELDNLLSKELHGQQVVIWADYTEEIKDIARYMHKKNKRYAVIDGSIPPFIRDEHERDFKRGALTYLICQPQASQYSRDFSNADTEIFYSSPLSLKTRLQAEDRLISSKTNSVLVIDLVCENTIEEDIIESIKKKETKQEMIKRIVQRLTGGK